jgi:Uma2 family endonuclease
VIAPARDSFWYDPIPVPRRAVRFPLEVPTPEGFRPDDPATWPVVSGRLEYVNGRLLYMPPCGDVQQDVCTDVTTALRLWARRHPGFRVGSNEAGMVLGGDTRAADVAVWRRTGPSQPGYSRVAPVLAVEVAGAEEDEAMLREKARWYLDAGVAVVWIVLPATREVVVITRDGELRRRDGETMPEPPALPDLTPNAGDFFAQLRSS